MPGIFTCRNRLIIKATMESSSGPMAAPMPESSPRVITLRQPHVMWAGATTAANWWPPQFWEVETFCHHKSVELPKAELGVNWVGVGQKLQQTCSFLPPLVKWAGLGLLPLSLIEGVDLFSRAIFASQSTPAYKCLLGTDDKRDKMFADGEERQYTNRHTHIHTIKVPSSHKAGSLDPTLNS